MTNLQKEITLKTYTVIWSKEAIPEIHLEGCRDIDKKKYSAVMVKNIHNCPSVEKLINYCTRKYGDAYGYKVLNCAK